MKRPAKLSPAALNAHLRILGPAPKGWKWQMLPFKAELPVEGCATDIHDGLGGGGEWLDKSIPAGYGYPSDVYPHMRLWFLVDHGGRDKNGRLAPC